jgi:hypothetical protein
MARYILCGLSLCFMCGCNTPDVGRSGSSIRIGESRFRLVREARFEGGNLFDLAIRAGMYTRKGSEYLPGAKRGTAFADGRLWYGSNGVGLVACDPNTKQCSIYYMQDQAVPGHHLGILFGDPDFIFFAYGYHADLPDVRPNLEVYSLRHKRFARIISVSTKDAKLGRSSLRPFLQSGRLVGNPPQMGWNDRRHAGKEMIELSEAGLAHPESIVLRDGVFELRYHESWGIEEFLTVLRFTEADLLDEFNQQAQNAFARAISQ